MVHNLANQMFFSEPKCFCNNFTTRWARCRPTQFSYCLARYGSGPIIFHPVSCCLMTWILEYFPVDWLSVIDACVIRHAGAIHVPVVCFCLLFRIKFNFCNAFYVLPYLIFMIYSIQVTQGRYTCLQIPQIILKQRRHLVNNSFARGRHQ